MQPELRYTNFFIPGDSDGILGKTDCGFCRSARKDPNWIILILVVGAIAIWMVPHA